MADIRNWKTDADANAVIGAINWAEGMPPALVNDSARAMMAELRGQFEDGGWFNYGHAITYLGPGNISVEGDCRAIYAPGRRLRAEGEVSGRIFGTVIESSFAGGVTNVGVGWDASPPVHEVLAVAVSLLDALTLPLPAQVMLADLRQPVPAAALLNLGGAGHIVEIDGDAEIQAIGTAPPGTVRLLRFRGRPRLRHDAQKLELPGAADLVMSPGDFALLAAEVNGRWRCVWTTRGTSPSASSSPNGLAFRNRLINGAMAVDQRTAGAVVTAANTSLYTLDRWAALVLGAGMSLQVQRLAIAGAPSGCLDALRATVATAKTTVGSDTVTVEQKIEGALIRDLGFGTAGARAVTLSFDVQASIAGAYSVVVQNFAGGARQRSYIATFTVDQANTPERKTITIPGDATGAWATDAAPGLILAFDLGCGPALETASTGQWLSGDFRRAAGTVKLIGAAGATFHVTGVQLEEGSAATAFERRPLSVELALCERYFQILHFGVEGQTAEGGPYQHQAVLNFRTPMRAAPSVAMLARPGAGSANVTYTGVAWQNERGMNVVFNAASHFYWVGILAHLNAEL